MNALDLVLAVFLDVGADARAVVGHLVHHLAVGVREVGVVLEEIAVVDDEPGSESVALVFFDGKVVHGTVVLLRGDGANKIHQVFIREGAALLFFPVGRLDISGHRNEARAGCRELSRPHTQSGKHHNVAYLNCRCCNPTQLTGAKHVDRMLARDANRVAKPADMDAIDPPTEPSLRAHPHRPIVPRVRQHLFPDPHLGDRLHPFRRLYLGFRRQAVPIDMGHHQLLIDGVVGAHQVGVARIVVDDHLVDLRQPVVVALAQLLVGHAERPVRIARREAAVGGDLVEVVGVDHLEDGLVEVQAVARGHSPRSRP